MRTYLNCEWPMVNDRFFSAKEVRVLFCFLFFFIPAKNFSQSASAALDRDKILLGEQVTLQFSLNSLNPLTTFVITWPHITDTVNHIEIIKQNAIDTILVNGLNSYTQSFTLTGFDSGRWQLGPFNFILQDKPTGKQIKLSTQPLYLTVLPVDVSSLKDYHPIKDVIGVTTSFNWLPVIIGTGVLVAAIIVFIIIKKRKKKIVAKPKIILKGTPLERAMEKLQKLQSHALTSIAEIKEFHSDIDIICRQYFEEMMHIQALQATTEELFSRINVYMQDAVLRSKMRQLFELNASVKFAKYMPAAEQSRAALQEMIACLQTIDASAQQAKEHADRLVSKY